MQSKKNNLFTNRILSLIAVLLICQMSFAQKVKIDGVGVVVGKNIVLDSDIEKFKLELENNSEGKIKISDCEMLEQLMMQKLLAHHAVIDSIVVSDAEVNASVERNIQFFTQEYGSLEKVISVYGFNDLADLKKELFTIEKETALVRKENIKITEDIDVTPEEVRIYYNGLKSKGELPEFPAEVKIAQLVLNVIPSKEENERVIKKLQQLKKEIEGGSSFRMKALINSNDPGVTQNGGRYQIKKNSPFIKEFKEVAFSLEVGQVSEPFKSAFGYHIVKLHQVRGEVRDVSHILIEPEISENQLSEAKSKLQKIKDDILLGKITFEDAVKKYSEDEATKNNGGLLLNGYSGESYFDLNRMDPALYARVNALKKGDLTDVFYDEVRAGNKMWKIIIMKDRTENHTADLVDDYVKIQGLALQKKKQEEIAKWSKNKIKETYIKLGDQYQKCTFKKNWKKEINK